ncbi:2-oxoacid:ferredoxin oxidoreductase subunit beta [archaeon]|nr:MAG: 2-oxoacid:ferredoxin oxidoreductase subunit beta [archaeon]HDM23733.1 2-oxoacid:ferredoxin oxidoreductase subunit beta [Candidatus Bathyarchaeota archaeon]
MEVMPHVFCPGCGAGIVANCFLRAVYELGYEDLSKFAFCSGIGCAAWIPSPFFKADSLHIMHGRSIPAAMGIKLMKPELKVVVFGGDGDIAGIGGNHLLHAARRNLEILVIMVNNMVYGMTGGQVAPTTPFGAYTTTTPYGNIEYPIKAAEVVATAGASYVARWTVYHTRRLINSIKKALNTEGFSFIEVVSTCFTSYGRRMGFKSPAEMIVWLKENSIPISEYKKNPEKYAGKIPVGEIECTPREGYVKRVWKMIHELSAKSS